MWFKKTLFEPAIRVPLIISVPGRAAGRVAAPVTLMDIFPTLVDLAGAPSGAIQTQLDGRSLAPALEGGTVTGPALVEHIDGGTEAPRVMVRDGDMKLVMSRAYPDQFYDLGNDPDEMTNLAGTPEAAEVEARLKAIVAGTWDLDRMAE